MTKQISSRAQLQSLRARARIIALRAWNVRLRQASSLLTPPQLLRALTWAHNELSKAVRALTLFLPVGLVERLTSITNLCWVPEGCPTREDLAECLTACYMQGFSDVWPA